MRGIVAVAVLVLGAGPALAQAPDAQRARIARYETMYAQTRDPGVLWVLAEAYARVGEKAKAVEALEGVADARQDFLPDASVAFEPLRGDPGFEAVRARMLRELTQVRRGRTALEIQWPGLVPEGVAYDPATRRTFIGDGNSQQVYAVDRDGRARSFSGPLQAPPLGMKVDAARGRLWVATANTFWDVKEKRSEVLALDLKTGAVLQRATHPEAQSFNDMALTPNGDLYVTDTLGGAVFRLGSGAREMERVTPAGAVNGPNGIAATDDGRSLFVAQGANLRRIDLADRSVTTIARPQGATLIGIDGLYWSKGGLIAVQNVGMRGRVLRLGLNAARDAVERVEVLEAGGPVLDTPTTAAVVGDRAYVLANAQLDRLKSPGVLDKPELLKPIVILELPV
jgi:sugar lactone lactonase YvrE